MPRVIVNREKRESWQSSEPCRQADRPYGVVLLEVVLDSELNLPWVVRPRGYPAAGGDLHVGVRLREVDRAWSVILARPRPLRPSVPNIPRESATRDAVQGAGSAVSLRRVILQDLLDRFPDRGVAFVGCRLDVDFFHTDAAPHQLLF